MVGREIVRLDREHQRVQLVLQARALRIVQPLEPGAGIAERAEAHLPAQQGRHAGEQTQQPLIKRRRSDRGPESSCARCSGVVSNRTGLSCRSGRR